jgi:diacylglycerol kinase
MKKRMKSFLYAGRGIRLVFGSEPNMHIHFMISILVVIFGFFFGISKTEWVACLLCFGLVFTAEMINTAIENIVDLVSPEFNKLAANAKDIAAGAVFVSAIISAIIGLLIFVPKVWNLL